MRSIMRYAAATAVFTACALADSWTGTVVDVMCKGKDLASHTRQCAIGCAKSGYGLVLQDGKFIKFDEKGNAKTLAALKTSSKDKDLKAKVSGTLAGEVLNVEAIELQ
ncbi:MAG: hypothetical protein NTY38_08625 [Acidobacteria bacterium]|nr:hypothetical protein [Acidobacteriota bacterium]